MEAVRTDLETVQGLTAELESFAEEMARRRDRYFDFFHLAPDPYLVTDIRGTLLELNAAAESLTRLSRQTLIGRPIVLFIAGGARRAFRSRLDLLAAGSESTAAWPTVLRLADGAERPAEARVRKVDGGAALSWLLRLG